MVPVLTCLKRSNKHTVRDNLVQQTNYCFMHFEQKCALIIVVSYRQVLALMQRGEIETAAFFMRAWDRLRGLYLPTLGTPLFVIFMNQLHCFIFGS
jgi:hypothetical protein